MKIHTMKVSKSEACDLLRKWLMEPRIVSYVASLPHQCNIGSVGLVLSVSESELTIGFHDDLGPPVDNRIQLKRD